MAPQSLSQIVVRDIATQGFVFWKWVFIASGFQDRVIIDRQYRKIVNLQQRIIGNNSPEQDTEENLELLASYFQKLSVNQVEEYKPHKILQQLLRSQKKVEASTLSLTILFNMIGSSAGISRLSAYNCDGYYFPVHTQQGCSTGLSYEIRRLTPDQHRAHMQKKKHISNSDLVADIAHASSTEMRKLGKEYAAQRYATFEQFCRTLNSD